MKNFTDIMKQAQDLQSKMTEIQSKMTEIEVKGSSAAGMCEITMTGKGEVLKVRIDPSLVSQNDICVMEDLILAAFNDAKSKADTKVREKMSDLTNGLPLPLGLQLPF